jgi:hypothetical protein
VVAVKAFDPFVPFVPFAPSAPAGPGTFVMGGEKHGLQQSAAEVMVGADMLNQYSP